MTERDQPERPSLEQTALTNLTYRSPSGEIKTGPGTDLRGIPAAERKNVVAKTRLAEQPANRITRPEGQQAARTWKEAANRIGEKILETHSSIRELSINDRERLLYETRERIPQSILRELVKTTQAVSGPADINESSWNEITFQPPQPRTIEQKILAATSEGGGSSPIRVLSWPHEAQWGVPQHFENESFLNDFIGEEQPINQPPTPQSSERKVYDYILRGVIGERDAPLHPIKRAEIYVPPTLLSSYKGQPLEKPPTDGGVQYTFFEGYTGLFYPVRTDYQGYYNTGMSGHTRLVYLIKNYYPTSEEIVTLTWGLRDLHQLSM
jgi:hypothetical protein